MAAIVSVSPLAHKDLVAIARYTRRTWGTAQRNRYLNRLRSRFEVLAETPLIGTPRDDIAAGCRDFFEGRHHIVYRVSAEGITILRVLHHSRDHQNLLDGP